MKYKCHSLNAYFTEGKPCLSFSVEDLNHKRPYDATEIHRHDYYEIILFEKGRGKHIIEFDSFDLQDNSISVVFPRQFHKLTLEKGSVGKVIMFNEELFCSEILKKELRAYCIDLQKKLNNIKPDEEHFLNIKTQFSMIGELFKEINVFRKEQIRHLIKIILMILIDISKQKELSSKEISESNTFLEFSNLVDNNFKKMRMVNDYSEKLGMSQKKLNALTQKHSGQTALQFIHERILLEAKRMLIFSGFNHKEIAYELNFDSPSAFNKFIKNKTNSTPSELQFMLTNIYNKTE